MQGIVVGVFFSSLSLSYSLAAVVTIYVVLVVSISAISAVALYRMITNKSKSLRGDDNYGNFSVGK